jgi:GT2 family glycosyltransferase
VFNQAAVPVHYETMREMASAAESYTRSHWGQAFDIPMLAMYCLAMRRDVYRAVGPLDEKFGVGMFEDDDYALRARAQGYRVICAEDVYIHHAGRSSFSKLEDTNYRRIFEENRRYFETKWNTTWQPPAGRS